MHHAHVNCKEQTMNRYMIEEYHSSPAVLRSRLVREAHRQRAQAIGDAIAWLFGSVGRLSSRLVGYAKARLTARPAGWTERLG
jgi:hypothetical protein